MLELRVSAWRVVAAGGTRRCDGSDRRALEFKLAALSQSMIARLIRNHDQEHRLEGFLKITQAAQTDALVRVLDEKLARYLAQVLDEVGSKTESLARGGSALFLGWPGGNALARLWRGRMLRRSSWRK